MWPSTHITQHPQPANLVHEQRRDDVAWQHSQGAQETDKVDHVGIVVITDVTEQAALFVVQESAVDELGVDQPILEEIWGKEREGCVEEDGERGDRQGAGLKGLISTVNLLTGWGEKMQTVVINLLLMLHMALLQL